MPACGPDETHGTVFRYRMPLRGGAVAAGTALIKVSGGTNTLRSIRDCYTDHMHLLHSDTPEGRFRSELLLPFFTDIVQCHKVNLHPLTALKYGYDDKNIARKGLSDLVDDAIKAAENASKILLEPVFCATCGFKAEIDFPNLMRALLKVEVYYIHEQFRETVRPPRLPLVWDSDRVLQRQEFSEWITRDLRLSRRPILNSDHLWTTKMGARSSM